MVNEFPDGSKARANLGSKTAVLLFSGFFLPGFKGGGPIRTVANMVDKLGDEIDFSIVTSDRDLGDIEPYADIVRNQWRAINKAKIIYLSHGFSWFFMLWKIMRDYQGRVIYLNSFFSFRHSILPALIWRVVKFKGAIIIGPRGEFSQGALELKSLKKRIFIFLAKWTRMYRNAIWYASSEYEAEDIRRVVGKNSNIRIAINIASPPEVVEFSPRLEQAPLRIVFLSRISPKKNLLGALKILQKVRTSVVFDVYGPTEDEGYWGACGKEARLLNDNVEFNYRGVLYPAQIPDILAGYDLFFFPTFGENFGHVIAEALGCGLPILISDTTPWRNLSEKGLGWDMPLEQFDDFVAAIEKCSLISDVEYLAWRKEIRAWALKNISNKEALEQNRQIFRNLEN